jgi:putative transferase (TIGR04331 family)
MKNLLVTSFSNNNKSIHKKIILGKWCFNKYDLKENFDSELKIKNSLKKKKLSESRIIEKRAINILSKILNKHHNINFNKKQWKIILGHWLRCYIRVFSNRYLHLSKILNTKKIDYFNYTKDSNSTNNNEIKNFIEKIKDDNFNDEIYKKIILFKKKKISIKVKKTKTNNSTQERFGILNLFNLFSLKNEKIFISELYLSKIGNILLHLRLKIAPRFWSCVNFTKYSSLNSNLRIELNKKVKPKKINLDSFLLSNIFEYMPKAYLEDFNNISKFVKDKFPKKPEIIVTANSFFLMKLLKILLRKITNNQFTVSNNMVIIINLIMMSILKV